MKLISVVGQFLISIIVLTLNLSFTQIIIQVSQYGTRLKVQGTG